MTAARFRRKYRQSGFTLVELLTVVVIIGVLVALLMPAIIAARNTAKRAHCLNNHHEIHTAIAQYDAQKGYLPGALNNSPTGSGTLSWAVVIFPYLGREDLWEQYRSGGAGSAQVVKQYVCPLDNTVSGNAPLSYVVNANLFLNRAGTGVKPRISLSDVKSQSRTPLLADRISTSAPPGRQWTSTTIGDLTFTWPTSGTPTLKSVVPSSHQGTVIITFCDGSTETLDEEAQANLYLPGP